VLRTGAAHGELSRQHGGANCGTQYPVWHGGGFLLPIVPLHYSTTGDLGFRPGSPGILGPCRHAYVHPHLLSADVARPQNTEPGTGRKGSSEVPGLGRCHPHPLPTTLTLVTDTVFAVTIRIARATTHARVSWRYGAVTSRSRKYHRGITRHVARTHARQGCTRRRGLVITRREHRELLLQYGIVPQERCGST
jgi:hypothetical protein